MRTVIIKWHPTRSRLDFSTLFRLIGNCRYGRIEVPVINSSVFPKNMPHDTRFYLAIVGPGVNGIFATGIMSDLFCPDISNIFEHDHIILEFETLINPLLLPIMSIDDVKQLIPYCSFDSQTIIELLEDDTKPLEKLWHTFLDNNHEVLNASLDWREGFWQNKHSHLERHDRYKERTVLLN